MDVTSVESEILATLDRLKKRFGIAAVARALGEADNHHNANVCAYCTHNGEFVMVKRASIDVLRQAVADGEVHTTKPVNRALIELFDARAGSDGDR